MQKFNVVTKKPFYKCKFAVIYSVLYEKQVSQDS